MVHHSGLSAISNRIVVSIKTTFYRRWLWFLFAVALLLLPLSSLAQNGNPLAPALLNLTDSQEKYPLGLHLELLQDPTGQLTIDDVSSPAYDDQFSPSQAEIPNLGYTPATIWVRFRVRNQASPVTDWRLVVADGRLKVIDMYLVEPVEPQFAHQQAGRFRPFIDWAAPFHYATFKLPLPSSQEQSVYLRFQSAAPMILPLTLWSLEAFNRYGQAELLEFGLLYGALLIMLGYNLFLFVSLRNRSYLYLSLMIATISLSSAISEGLAQQYLWPQWRTLYGQEILSPLANIIFLVFAASFLETKVRTPRLHKMILATLALAAISLASGFLARTYAFQNISVLLAGVIVLAAVLLVWRQGYRPARFFLLAWLVSLMTVLLNALINVGVLNVDFSGPRAVLLGVTVMVLLLSLALAEHNQLEQRAADRTAELSQANQQLSGILDTLEQRVAERTRQLSTFLDMTMLVGEARTLAEVVDIALNRVMEFCQCQGLALHLLNNDQTGLTLLTCRGLSAVWQKQLQTVPLEPPLNNWFSQRYEPLLMLGSDDSTHLPAVLQLDDFRVYMGVQLRARERILGMLSYYRFAEQTFSLDEISLLAALAEQLTIIIENHRLRRQIEKIAVIAERQRLARDLHDSINQSLYSINLFVHAAREASEDGDPGRLADRLTRIETITLDALKGMRLLLYQLQPDILAEKGLVEALKLRFDSVERRLGIEVDYQAVGQVVLPPDIAEALYWAAMEALNNSLKHAEANHLAIRLTLYEPVIELEIADNGHGFETERVNGGMGLRNIEQRLAQLNGWFYISSAVGAGTTIKLALRLDGEPVEQRVKQ